MLRVREGPETMDLDTPIIAMYVKNDDELGQERRRA